MTDHSCDRVEEQDEGYVLRCRCGWRSTPHASAAAVGIEWDQHRGEVADQAC